MTVRFSCGSFEPPHHPASDLESASAPLAAGSLPVAGCELLTSDMLAGYDRTLSAAADSDDIYLPEHYEANYAYPLIIWLAPPNSVRGRLHRLMRSISERNYLGVSLPVADPRLIEPGQIEERLLEVFLRVRRSYHVHTERVYLLGIGEWGTLALETALRRPDWFAGVGALSARCPESPCLLAQFNRLRGKRVWLGIDESESAPLLADCLYMQHLFWSAGMQVTALASSPGEDCRRGLFREIDRWIMQAVDQTELVC